MSPEQQWQKLKKNYLRQVEDALASTDQSKSSTILQDVNEHLERKYAELPADKLNWEGYQQILIEMGPPQDYADLLMEGKMAVAKSTSAFNTFLAILFVFILAGVGSYLVYTARNTVTQSQEVVVQEEKSPIVAEEVKVKQEMPVAFVISFKSASPLQTGTAQELLSGFSKHHHPEIRTHHYRTKIQDNELIGNICVDSKSDADAIKEMLQQNDTLKFIKIKPATQKEFEQFCFQKQVSLPSDIEQSKPVQNESIEIIETPVIPEPAVVGKWSAVDRVKNIEDFNPNYRMYKKRLILNDLHFTESEIVYWNFNSGVVKQSSFNDETFHTVKGDPAKYIINQIDGQDYLFIEWITPEVIKEGEKPDYYVLRRQQEPYTIDIKLAKNNESPVGQWISVDFVTKIADFRPAQKQWNGVLYLKDLTFFENGNTSGPWTWKRDYLWHPGDRTKSHFTVQQMQGTTYLFMEWMSGDVTYRNQKPRYYVLKKKNITHYKTPRHKDFALGASYCTPNFAKSILGSPSRVDMNGRMLRYNNLGVDLLFSRNGSLSEAHLNKGYRGQLETGISLNSSKQDVFAAYGRPIRTVQTDKLSGKNDERILYEDGKISRIYYGRHGLIFWFNGDTLNQIVLFKGRFNINYP